QHGLGYGLLRYLHPNRTLARELAAMTPAEVSFNYLGQLDAPAAAEGPLVPLYEERGEAAPADSSTAPSPSLTTGRFLIEITGQVTGGELAFRWLYRPSRHRRATIERLASSFKDALGHLIAHCRAPDAGGYTPSDVPLAGLTQRQLDDLVLRATGQTGRQGKAQIEDIYPLAPLQQGMIWKSLFVPEERLYLEQLDGLIRGAIDPGLFEAAWQLVVARHPMLRTLFAWQGLEEPLQIVLRHARIPFTYLDWRDLAPDQQAARLAEYRQEDRVRGFDLGRAPLLRVSLIRQEENAYRFVWSHHHLLLDGWSVGLVFRDVLECYRGLAERRVSLPESGAPYRRYIAWLKQQDVARARAFWQGKLSGLADRAQLPLDLAPTTPNGERHGEAEVSLSREATAALQALARRHQLTTNTCVQGAWGILLSRYGRTGDVLFGVTVSDRPAALPQIESTVGLFINTLPMRLRVTPGQQLIPWLQEVQAQQAELDEYKSTSLTQIQAWCALPPSALFDSVIIFENYPIEESVRDQRSLGIEDIHTDSRTDLGLGIVVLPGEALRLRAMFDARQSSRAAVHQMLVHLGTLLEEMVRRPEAKLADFTLLTEAESYRLLFEGNQTATDYPRTHSLHRLFEAQAAATPQAVAIVTGEETVTYRALNSRANRLARYLLSQGVGAEALVGLYMERSVDVIAAILAVLKVGAAYVPIDLNYPAERVRYLLTDSRVEVLLTQTHLLSRLPADGPRALPVDSGKSAITRAKAGNLPLEGDADHLAYVMYTSGSTGTPKGVCVSHRNIVRLVRNTNYVEVKPSDVFLQAAPLSFDAATFEIWAALLNGARLALLPPGPFSLNELGGAIARHGVTVLWLTAGLFQQMVEGELAALRGLRVLLAGGDVLSAPHVRRVL
ncbi:MAG TPA: condensation domain-containing protein, partial [Polyangia bacterium]|nr:condensation domain-containing protein [Polyangia bacterium]